MTNIQEILIAALKERSIFHSEADFQHHFAWWIHTKLENAELRLEYPVSKDDSVRREYCDIVLKSPSNIGIEVKYKTNSLIKRVKQECFDLRESPQDLARYDFLNDVQRLENWCLEKKIDCGYAILLTNHHLYWSAPRGYTNDKNFRIHNRKITGELTWAPKSGAGTKRKPIILKKEYELNWQDVDNSEGFRYLFVEVKC